MIFFTTIVLLRLFYSSKQLSVSPFLKFLQLWGTKDSLPATIYTTIVALVLKRASSAFLSFFQPRETWTMKSMILFLTKLIVRISQEKLIDTVMKTQYQNVVHTTLIHIRLKRLILVEIMLQECYSAPIMAAEFQFKCIHHDN